MRSELPKYVLVWYKNNPQTGCYIKTEEQPGIVPFNTLPYWLKVEPAQNLEIRTQVKLIIRGREKDKRGKYLFFAGLAEIPGTNHFVSNHYRYVNGFKKTDLVIFCFSKSNSRLWVFYFPGFDKKNLQDRITFAAGVIPALLAKHTNEQKKGV